MHSIQSVVDKLKAAKRNADGTSAVEFSFIAPLLVFVALATMDVGLALSERMELDHVLRSGAQGAMHNLGEDEVQKLIEATAKKNFTIAGGGASQPIQTIDTSGAKPPVSLSVKRFCACPEATDTAVSCFNTCAAEVPPNIYYDMLASTTYAGIIFPNIDFNVSMRVEIR